MTDSCVIVRVHHASFRPMHEDPLTGLPWTEATAERYRGRCLSTGREGLKCDVLVYAPGTCPVCAGEPPC